jgi:hypothetical protein
MIPLEMKQVQELATISIQRAIDYLKGDEIEDKDDFQ